MEKAKASPFASTPVAASPAAVARCVTTCAKSPLMAATGGVAVELAGAVRRRLCNRAAVSIRAVAASLARISGRATPYQATARTSSAPMT